MLYLLCRQFGTVEDSILGFFVDRYDTVWYMRLRLDNFTPNDRGGVHSVGRLGRRGPEWEATALFGILFIILVVKR
jgi:hypothetical protein